MVAEVYTSLLNNNLVSSNDVVSFLTDELVLDIPDPGRRSEIVEFLKGFRAFPIRVSEFLLKKLRDVKGFKKVFSDGSVEFKCVPVYDLPSVVREYKYHSECDIDKYFSFEGRLAKFVSLY